MTLANARRLFLPALVITVLAVVPAASSLAKGDTATAAGTLGEGFAAALTGWSVAPRTLGPKPSVVRIVAFLLPAAFVALCQRYFVAPETVVMLYLTGPYVAVHWHMNA